MRAVMVTLAAAVALAGSGAGQSFRTRVDGVTVDVAVTSSNRPVDGLTAADFELTDSGVRQRILDVHREDLPLDVTVVADVSGGGLLFAAIAAGVEKIRHRLHDSDRARLVTFDDQVHDHGLLAEPRALPQIATRQTLDAFKPPAETALFDAVASALEAPRETGRRPVVILFSAGRDTRSRLASAQVIERARRVDFPVFVVLARLNFEPRDAPPAGTTRLPVPVVSHAVPQRFYSDLAAFTGALCRPWNR